MSEQISPRHRFFVDCEVQSAVLIRVGLYGAAATLYFAITLICTQWMHEPDRGFFDCLQRCFEDIVYWLPGFLFLAPVAAHDLLKMTNQFAGPVARLRREMRLLIEGRSDRPLSFREDDYWVELTADYNQVRGELLQLRQRVADLEVLVPELPASMLSEEALEDSADAEPSTAISEDATGLPTDQDDSEATVVMRAAPVAPLPEVTLPLEIAKAAVTPAAIESATVTA